MPVRLAAVLVLAAALAAPALAQRPTRRIVSRPWPSATAAATPAPTAAAPTAAGLDPETPEASVPSDVRAAAAPVVSAPSDMPVVTATFVSPPTAAPTAPTRGALSVFGRTGLRVSLPADWDAAETADEARLPAYALYTFANRAAGPLAGVVVRVEQVVGLNPAEQQQWRSGQTRYGYHGTRPTGPLAVAGALAAFETAGAGTRGASAFFQRGTAFWTVQVEAPLAVWAARRGGVLALVSGVTLPAGGAAARR